MENQDLEDREGIQVDLRKVVDHRKEGKVRHKEGNEEEVHRKENRMEEEVLRNDRKEVHPCEGEEGACCKANEEVVGLVEVEEKVGKRVQRVSEGRESKMREERPK